MNTTVCNSDPSLAELLAERRKLERDRQSIDVRLMHLQYQILHRSRRRTGDTPLDPAMLGVLSQSDLAARAAMHTPEHRGCTTCEHCLGHVGDEPCDKCGRTFDGWEPRTFSVADLHKPDGGFPEYMRDLNTDMGDRFQIERRA
jgi:hypothetical protein